MSRKNKTGIGIDVGSRKIQLAMLRSTKNGVVLEKVATEELPHDAIVEGRLMDTQAVTEKLAKLLKDNKLKGKKAALSIGGRRVMIKKIATEEMSNDELKSAIEYEAKANLPFDLQEVSLDYAKVSQDVENEGMEVLLVAAKNDVVYDSVETFFLAGGKTDLLEAEPFALQAALTESGYIDDQTTVATLQIGFQTTDVTIFHRGQFEGNRNLNIGGKSYIEGLIKHLGISFERATTVLAHNKHTEEEEKILKDISLEVSTKLAEQIDRSFPEYFGTIADKPVTKIILCGGGAHLPMIDSAFRSKFGIEVETANPFRTFEINPKTIDPSSAELGPDYAAAVGLALRSIGENYSGFNLLFHEDRPEYRQARYAGATTVLTVLGISGVLFAMVMVHLSQENKLSSLEARLSKIRKETDLYRDKINLVEDLSKKRADVATRIDVISDLDRNRFVHIKVLDLINKSVPVLTWVTTVQDLMTSNGPGIAISGYTSSNLQVSQFMTTLLQSKMIKGVDLTVSQQTEIAGTEVIQFTLQATIPELALREIKQNKKEDQIAKGAKAVKDKRAAEDKLKSEAAK